VLGTPCPYCDHPINPTPTRKKKCPHCGQFVFVRSGKLLTEFGAHIHDEEMPRLRKTLTRILRSREEGKNVLWRLA